MKFSQLQVDTIAYVKVDKHKFMSKFMINELWLTDLYSSYKWHF